MEDGITVTAEVKCPFCNKILLGTGDTADEANEEADEKLEDHFHSNIC